MAIEIKDKSLCCGCMACANVCPKDAIRAAADENGFLYPQVDPQLCVECGLCEKTCDFTKKQQAIHTPQKAASLIHKEPAVVRNSTSGGAFTALSDLVLQQGGIVVGAAMDDDFTVYHHVSQNASQRDAMRGSLYVQSDIRDSYRQVRSALKEGKKAMFVGSPCQVAGLRSFLGKEDENLLVVEFLCHGVPNNEFFKAHIAYLEKEYGKKATGYSFREKRYGWTARIEQLTTADGKTLATKLIQAYTRFFYAGVTLRPSCRSCSYRQTERSADLTVGDFWGIEKLTGKRDEKGVSLLFANTPKGETWLRQLESSSALQEYPVESLLSKIPTKSAPSRMDPETFWSLYREKGYSAVVSKYYKTSLKSKVQFALKKAGRRLFWGQ